MNTLIPARIRSRATVLPARSRITAFPLLALAAAFPATMHAQNPPLPRDIPAPAAARDTLSLGALHDAAATRDARSAMPTLLRDASALRDRDIVTDRRLRSVVNAQATHQSDVTTLPVRIPGSDVPTPPYSRFQLTLDLEQSIYDASATPARRAVERARLGEAESDVNVQLHRLRQDVNVAVFTTLLLQERLAELDVVRDDIGQRLTEARARVREGSALSRDTSTLVAERLRIDETHAEVDANRRAALTTLGSLTGRTYDPASPISVQSVSPREEDARDTVGTAIPRARPEFHRFEATRRRIAEEARAVQVENRPRLSAFAQAGVGRPGLNQLATDTDPFYIVGVRASWKPFERGTVQRREEQLHVQQRLTDLEERAFAEALHRATATDREEIARLEAARARDAELIAARADVERVARLEYEEGAATAAAWIATRTALMEARFTARRHAVELEYARARLLTTLGLPLR